LRPASAKAGKQLNAHRVIGHALAKGVEMLLGQDRGGHEHSGLSAIHDGLEGGANANFGFAEANVAADEAVHRFGPLHVSFGFDDGAHLIGRFFEDKGALELALPARYMGNGMARLTLSPRPADQGTTS